MKLANSLVLFKYLLTQFGFKTFDELKEKFSGFAPRMDSAGQSLYANMLLASPVKISKNDILRYDTIILEYEEMLRKNRAEPYLSFKYFQYFALLFTEFYFENYQSSKEIFLQELNAFKNAQRDFNDIEDFQASDLKKLAYWMATGSGKTLIMHVNYWQLKKYFKDWENIILITPNEGLSLQHYEEFCKSGIKAKLYSGSEESLKTQAGEVLIIEITKLVKGKEGEGVSVDVDYFSESRNLVFIDEGHKGQRSEEKAWKQLREHLTRGEDSFAVEYSATFGQIIGNREKDLLNEYGKAIIFDYSYRHFYLDGYGKDFTVFNITAETSYSDEQIELLLTGSLLGFYEQLILFEKYRRELEAYNIEKPLWIFVGSKVVGKKSSLTQGEKKSVSDVALVLKYLKKILSNPKGLQDVINKILDENSGLMGIQGEDIFKSHFHYLKQNRPDAHQILERIFNGTGELEAWQLKQAEGEIGLKTSLAENYFGVINIGDVSSFKKKLIEDFKDSLEIKEDNFSTSLFQNIPQMNSTVNVLIGSKKFVEGWNSWRVSSMGLMNMGKNEGTQIIQLFGRGVRLKGRDFSLKREEDGAPYYIRALQTISIFGLNAEYMNNFLTSIEKEIDKYREFSIPIKFNAEEKWNDRIVTVKTEENLNFRKAIISLELDDRILKRVQINLRPKVAVKEGIKGYVAEPDENYFEDSNFLKTYFAFIDFDKLYLATLQYKSIRRYSNLVIRKEILSEIIKSDLYQILVLPNQFTIEDALSGKVQNIAFSIVKDYIDKFYSAKEKDFVTRNLTYDFLNKNKYSQLFPENDQIIVKIPESKIDELEKIFKDFDNFYKNDIKEIPTIHFDKHLYSPIAVYQKGKENIKTIPVKLNEGEKVFITHLREYFWIRLNSNKDIEVFVLRNLSKRGLGFFMESSSFFPDFIIWLIKNKTQYIIFVDPKGILMLGNFGHEKILFCTEIIKEIERKVKAKMRDNGEKIQIHLQACILSFSKYDDIKEIWGEQNATIADFKRHNVLFMDDRKQYILDIFDKIIL